jgi:chaperonin GroES
MKEEGCCMKLKPLEDRVIVKAVEKEETTASGIVLPDTAKEKPMKGEVVAVGAGKWDESGKNRVPVDVKVGDKVIYGKYSGTEYKTTSDDEVLILRASEILAIVE